MKSNEDNINLIDNINLNSNEETTKASNENIKYDIYASEFPNWDLIPPYTTVRRVNRN